MSGNVGEVLEDGLVVFLNEVAGGLVRLQAVQPELRNAHFALVRARAIVESLKICIITIFR